jgi:signal transduction histidine kinase
MRILPESIRGRVAMLIVAISLPLLGVLLWGFISQVNRQRAEARHLALRIARSVASDIRDSNQRARALLLRMSQRPKVQQANSLDCDPLFSIVDFFPQYLNLVLYDVHGSVMCSASPAQNDAAYWTAAAPLVANAIRTYTPANDTVVVASLDRWVFVTLQPVVANGRTVGILSLAQYLDLTTEPYPRGTIITVSDMNRRILARSADGRRWMGKVGNPTPSTRTATQADEGRLETVGIDGIARQYGFKHVRTLPWRVFVGLPSSVAMAGSRNFLARGLILGAIVLALVTLLAVRITRTIERPLAALTTTVKRAAEPGFSEHVPIEGPREIQVVAQAFNGMITSRTATEKALVESTAQLEALSEKLLDVQEEERTRIAREIHDELGQLLTALNMDIGGLIASADLNVEQRLMAKRIRQALAETLSSVQRISTELRPAILDDFGLIAAMEQEAEKFEERTGIECDLSAPPEMAAMHSEVDAAIFRIVQEAMTNVARHSDGTRVEIRLRYRDDDLCVDIRDNGRGIPDHAIHDRHSIGLIGMRERARRIGGTLEVEGVPGHGTIVSLRVPIPPVAAQAHA